MDKKPLIGVSIGAVVLLILGSLTNVVGYQSVNSTAVNDSPLFRTRTQRATNQQQNILTAQYLGKGQYSIPFPVLNNRTELIQKAIDKIRAMDDISLNRFVGYAIHLLSQQEKTKDIDAKNIVKGLTQMRENPKMFQQYTNINDGNRTWRASPTLCWFPGCAIAYFIGYLIAFIVATYIIFTVAFNCHGPSFLVPCLKNIE